MTKQPVQVTKIGPAWPDSVTRPDLDHVRVVCCEKRKALARDIACFSDPLRVECPTCGARPPNACEASASAEAER